jgi:hypothetical protein
MSYAPNWEQEERERENDVSRMTRVCDRKYLRVEIRKIFNGKNFSEVSRKADTKTR